MYNIDLIIKYIYIYIYLYVFINNGLRFRSYKYNINISFHNIDKRACGTIGWGAGC